jgi:hypothetical protein
MLKEEKTIKTEYKNGIEIQNTNNNEVIIADIKMPFFSMVVFMVKWAIASIPAFIILMVLAMLVGVVLGGGADTAVS